MTNMIKPRRAWEPAFLAALREGLSARGAMKAAKVHPGTVYGHRNGNARFAREWLDALGPERAAVNPGRSAKPGRPARSARTVKPVPKPVHWRKIFLEALAETSNVSASAARANVRTREVYKLRREDGDFAAKWLAALREGYDNLEMEMLGYLRDPQPKRKMDVGAALRLLAAHRDTVERRRALAEDEDEQAVLDSIDRFIDEMRERRAANEAILAETNAETDTGTEAGDAAQ